MARYISVYYIAKDLAEINRLNKKVRVIECATSLQAKDTLINEFKATHIKSLREMYSYQSYIRNDKLIKIEMDNNIKLDKDGI